ncbi:uncharacterized protein EV422DRAFT_546698 [Fimicolochytrium jonesii]|uniref:uncharacterized protein n=1 Tax=Fimicolochytrium jonesii TaxID=1396493 RepID=UPI0022FDD057|nr:uncharacterized protein EV422DRAFT_546698 [Fimicolochytrium jonesii]KAI8816248.1 hypothetical protein EV422DRAFT_546698 [Fimicolochytrium jonesii]
MFPRSVMMRLARSRWMSRRRVISPFLSCIVLAAWPRAAPTFAAAPTSIPQPTDGERLVSQNKKSQRAPDTRERLLAL